MCSAISACMRSRRHAAIEARSSRGVCVAGYPAMGCAGRAAALHLLQQATLLTPTGPRPSDVPYLPGRELRLLRCKNSNGLNMAGISHAFCQCREPGLCENLQGVAQRHCGTREAPMETNDLKSMSLEELWKLHEEVIVRLSSILAAEKTKLEERLRRLRPQHHRTRRPYPKVFPKYQNPKNPTETWSGRGRQPRWLSPQLRSGKKLDDFRIHNSSDHARRAHA